MPVVAVEHAERRYKRRLPIKVQVTYHNLHEFLQDVSANLSVGGIFIQTDDPLKEGTRFQLHFSLPDEPRPISAVGEVCWVAMPEKVRGGRVPGMGITFADISTADQGRIARWMAERP